MDEIRIERLKIHANHGYYQDEKWNGQLFEINAVLRFPLQDAGMTDQLDHTINYAGVCELITEVMTEKSVDLIETVAEDLATQLLDRYRELEEVEIEVRKPEAPIPQEFSCVSVKVVRKRHLAYIAFGSNQGDSEALIQEAIGELKKSPKCHVRRVSSIIRTSPYGGVKQPDFYNGVLELETYYEPLMLLKKLQEIEYKLGRERKIHWGPRTIDLDIIFYDQMIIDSAELVVPHPDMSNRDFVLKPMAELAPYYRHPLLHKTVAEMLSTVKAVHIIGN